MFLDRFDNGLFRPLSSPNAQAYGISLWALYQRLVVDQLMLDECEPKEAREVIRLALLEQKQHIDWTIENDILQNATETDDAGRAYRYLRECGWLKEVNEVGYRQVVYIPQIASQLLSALNSIKVGRTAQLGATCRVAYKQLLSASDTPSEYADGVSVAAKIARDFHSDLSAMSGSIRDIAQRISDGESGINIVHIFFKDFLQGILLDGYSKLKTTNHPYRYREVTITLALEIQNSPDLLDKMVKSLHKEQPNEDPSDIRDQIIGDLSTIAKVFENIDQLLLRIEHYRRRLTKRSRDAIQYALTAVPDIALKIDKLITQINEFDDDVEIPALILEDTYISEERLYAPRINIPEPKATPINVRPPPIHEIAYSRAQEIYLRRRRENPERIQAFLEKSLGSKNFITTCEMTIDTLDDFLAYLQLRDLLHDAVSVSSRIYPLTKHYRLVEIPNEFTTNHYLKAPKLRVERRTSPAIRRQNHVT